MPNNTTNYNFNKPLVNNATDADLWGGYLNTNWDDVDSVLNTRTANLDFSGYKVQDASLEDCKENGHNLGNINGAVGVDYEDGHWQYGTLTGDITSITISNLPSSGDGAWLSLELIQDGTGSRLLTLGGAYKTAGGVTPVLTTTASARDFLHLTTRDSGTTIFARIENDFK